MMQTFLSSIFVAYCSADIVTQGLYFEEIASPSQSSSTESELGGLFTQSFHSYALENGFSFVIKDAASGKTTFKSSENELPTVKSNLQIWKKISPGSCNLLTDSGHKSGIYTILFPSGWFQVFCEMDFNGGGYTFFAKDSLPRLNQKDIDTVFTDKNNVLLRLLKPDGSQPYTVINQYKDTGGLSVQLNDFVNYTKPRNAHTSSYMLLGVQRRDKIIEGNISGFKSNGIAVTFVSCANMTNSHFVFYSSGKITGEVVRSCDNTKMDIIWRGSAVNNYSSPTMISKFFMLTELRFGGCGCYVESGLWPSRKNPALGTAIGMR